MKEKVETVSYVVGVDCAGQPLVCHHAVVSDEDDRDAKVVPMLGQLKPVGKPTLYSAPKSIRKHCGQSQKDVRDSYK